MTFEGELRQVFKGEIKSDKASLDAASGDASIFQIEPALVVAPKDSADLQSLVTFVSENKKHYPNLSLTARAAGTDMGGGPLTSSVVVDFMPHFQGTLNVDETHGEATVLPGTYYRDFEKQTLAKGLLLPCYTASRELNTVGGMVANNSAGEKTLTYGPTANYVKEIKVVLSDAKEHIFKPIDAKVLVTKESEQSFEGKLYRDLHKLLDDNRELIRKAKPKVSKNSAGYMLWDIWDGKTFNMTRLITGSQGTLGFVSEITFKLVKPKTHSTLLVIFLYDFETLPQLVNTVLKHNPESFESYDDHSMKLAVRFMPDFFRRLGVMGMLRLGWQFLPEMWMMATGGTPKMVLVAEFTGDSEEEVYDKARATEADLVEHEAQTHVTKADEHITKSDAEESKYWTIRRESFSLLRKHVHGKHTAPFIDDIIVAPEHLPQFLPKLTKLMKGYDIIYTIQGHIGNGNFHIIPLMDFGRPDFKKVIAELSYRVYDLVLFFGGSIAGEHNDGLIRTPYLEKMYGKEVVELFRQVKHLFDPQNIFNPGKKVGGSLAYSYEHIRHSWPR